MSLFTLALAAEFAAHGIAVNSLWPRTVIATAAVLYELGGEEMMLGARKPEIVADAAHAILTLPARQWTGRFLLDDEVFSLGCGCAGSLTAPCPTGSALVSGNPEAESRKS